jgi:hypothetical protein
MSYAILDAARVTCAATGRATVTAWLSGNDYGYGDATVADLDLDSGYSGTVLFEIRWYGTANSYADYVSNWVTTTVSH